MKWIGIAVATLFMASPVFACGVHGTNAGNDINDWLANQSDDGINATNDQSGGASSSANGDEAGWADGGQSSRDDDGNAVGFHWEGGDDEDVEVGEEWNGEGERFGMGNENYWVNITLPNGNIVTINTTPNSDDHDGSGGGIENWLFDQGVEVIRDWFENYEPEDSEEGTYVG